jgi:hypothetical protein
MFQLAIGFAMTMPAATLECSSDRTLSGQKQVWVPSCHGAGCRANGVDDDCAWCVYDLPRCQSLYGSACDDIVADRAVQAVDCNGTVIQTTTAAATTTPATVTSQPVTIPPEQSSAQQAAILDRSKAAKEASDAATPEVLAFFSSDAFRSALQECCPEAAQLTSEELLNRFRAEVQVAELAHAFPPVAGQGHFTDVTPDVLEQHEWFLNEWQAGFLSGSNKSKVTQNAAAVQLFGLPTSPDVGYSWDEASDRMIYVAHNFYQADTGSNPNFGDVCAIFSTDYVKDMVLIAPVDTGRWHMNRCDNVSDSDTETMSQYGMNSYNCSAWRPSIVGTLEHHDHIILANWATKANSSMPNHSMVDEAKRFFGRSAFAGEYTQLPNLTSNNYWESNIVGNPRLPEGVKFLIAQFPALFGTSAGRRIQELADHYGWPLVWALGDAGHKSGKHPPHPPHNGTKPGPGSRHSMPGNQRLLDPRSATLTTNVTLPEESLANFKAAWAIAEDARASGGNITAANVTAWWALVNASQIRIAPLTAQSCSDSHNCLGTDVVSKDCVCRPVGTMVA